MTLDGIFAQLAGSRIPGGCDDCDAFQQMTQADPGVWVLAVYHDDGCPALAARKEAS